MSEIDYRLSFAAPHFEVERDRTARQELFFGGLSGLQAEIGEQVQLLEDRAQEIEDLRSQNEALIKENREREKTVNELLEKIHQASAALPDARKMLIHQKSHGRIRHIGENEVEVEVETPTGTDLLCIARAKFSPSAILAVDQRLVIENLCVVIEPLLAPMAGDPEELDRLVSGLRGRAVALPATV